MFEALIIKPIFNLLVLIYGLLPGHNFGLSIILFTVVVRLLMWPLVKKQLHQAKAMRELQPELKRIKKAAAGNRQQESVMVMQLYKEKGINPFASIGNLLVQLPIFIALYSGIRRIVDNPQALADFSYPFLRGLSSIKELAADINVFDSSLLGLVDLTRAATSPAGVYWPAMLIVIGGALAQYIQSKQLMPAQDKNRKLKDILKEAGDGKSADQAEVSAAVGRSTRFLIPGLIFIFTVGLPSAISLYFLASGLVAMIQQGKVLKQDEEELVEMAEKGGKGKKKARGGAVVTSITTAKEEPGVKKPVKKVSKTSKNRKKKRRK